MFYRTRCKIVACLYALFFIDDISDIKGEIPTWYAKIQLKKYGIELNKEMWNELENDVNQVLSEFSEY